MWCSPGLSIEVRRFEIDEHGNWAAGADDTDINKITWENSCRFFGWDPFARTPREQATVKALRAKGADVDVSIRPRKEWARLYELQTARR